MQETKNIPHYRDLFLRDLKIKEQAIRFIGVVKGIEENVIQIEDENKTVNIDIGKHTVKPKTLKQGDQVRVFAIIKIDEEAKRYYIKANIIQDMNLLNFETYRKVKKLKQELGYG